MIWGVILGNTWKHPLKLLTYVDLRLSAFAPQPAQRRQPERLAHSAQPEAQLEGWIKSGYPNMGSLLLKIGKCCVLSLLEEKKSGEHTIKY
jgi:hypothetical protein